MIGSGRTLLRYAGAAGLSLAAVLVRIAVDLVVTIDLPFLVFFPAILAAALWLGTGPALFSALLGGLAAAWRWMPPSDSLAIGGASDVQGLVLYAVSSVLVAGLVHSSRASRERSTRFEVEEGRRWQGVAEQQLAELSQVVTARTEALAERDALMHAVVETAVDAILTIDERAVVRSFNRAAEGMFGYAAEEVIGSNVKLLMPSPYRDEHDAYIAHYLAGGAKKIIGIGREITARRKDGSTFPMYLSVSEVRVGERRLFTGFVRDLTEQKRLEQEFLRAQKMEAVGSLSGAIAHDFNNILMGILACARVSVESLRPGAGSRESFDEIAAAANRGVALTRRLLAFSRHGPPAELQPTDLNAVLRENETMLRQLLGEDVALRMALSAGETGLLADPGLIEQIVINLLVNARDALSGAGEITVATRVETQQVVLEVQDNGCGIPPQVRARIFEPFFTTKGPDKGTGLGLSTVKRITEQLQGRIELASELGRGTTFRLGFPRCALAPRTAEVPKPAGAAQSNGASLLLVEDDRLVRASLLRFLEGKGFVVRAAGTPSEALSAARSGAPIDVLITDMVLPELTGAELAGRLRASAPDLQVIYMSAHPLEMLIAQGHPLEGEPYLEKPFEMEDLEALLERLLPVPDDARS
jgi:PAS domain S-box-containing protein